MRLNLLLGSGNCMALAKIMGTIKEQVQRNNLKINNLIFGKNLYYLNGNIYLGAKINLRIYILLK